MNYMIEFPCIVDGIILRNEDDYINLLRSINPVYADIYTNLQTIKIKKYKAVLEDNREREINSDALYQQNTHAQSSITDLIHRINMSNRINRTKLINHLKEIVNDLENY